MFVVPLSRHAFPNAAQIGRAFDHLFAEGASDRCAAAAGTSDSRSDASPVPARTPALEVSESDLAYSVRLEMPGVAKDEIKVAIDGRRVNVEAARGKAAEKAEGQKIVYRERSASSYARSFTLPRELDQAESTAKLEHGVLTLTLAKRGAAQATHLTVN